LTKTANKAAATAVRHTLPDALIPSVKSGEVCLALANIAASPRGLHAGDPILLSFEGNRNGGGFPAWCVLRARVYLTDTGVLRVLGPFGTATPIHTEEGEALARLLFAAEQGAPAPIVHGHKLAKTIGHDNYGALWTAQKRLRLDKAHRAVREVVGWKLV
jgi:hypothetical protein